MITSRKKIIILSILLITVGIAGRLLPHMWNFTPIVAVALFAGVYLGRRYMILLPLLAMIVGDFFLGFYDARLMLSVYGSFALVGVFSYFIRKQKNVTTIMIASMSASTLFFLITNFVAWKITPWYSSDISGLMQSYTLAIPFFRSMLIGDLVFTGAFFGVYELVTNGAFRTSLQQVPTRCLKLITNQQIINTKKISL